MLVPPGWLPLLPQAVNAGDAPCPLPRPARPQLFTNSATALPAEVDEQGRMKQQPRSLWQRRLEATAERRRLQREQQQQQQ